MDCLTHSELTLGEVGDRLLKQLGNRRFPLSGSFEITERCNLSCLMCYINQPANSRETSAGELTLPQIRNVLDQLAGAGCLFLLLTGGEVLLRLDFSDIWRYAKQQGMILSLFTNGTLLTPRIADFLAEWRPSILEITLYGATQATYERITQVPGSYGRCMRGIELLLERGLRLNLKSVLLQANRHEVEAMQALAAHFGVPYRFDGMLIPRVDGDEKYPSQRLSPAELVALDREYPERQEEYSRLYRDLAGGVARNEYVYSCGGGQRSFHIDSTGHLSVCMTARRPAYPLLQGSFQEGWKILENVINRKRTQALPCTTCNARPLCMQCPGWSQLVHGDDETLVDYVCEIGRRRAGQVLAFIEQSVSKAAL